LDNRATLLSMRDVTAHRWCEGQQSTIFFRFCVIYVFCGVSAPY